MDAYWRLRDAKRDVGNNKCQYAIPRRIIINENLDIVKNGFQPIILQ